MGAPGDKTQLSKNDGVVSYSTIISISESPVMPGVVWAGTDDGNLQVSRDGGVDVHRSRPQHHRPARQRALGRQPVLDRAHRRVALRPGHGVRRGGRTPERRPAPVRVRHARLRQDVHERHRRPAAVRQPAGDPRRPEEQGPAVRRHRVRPVRLARRRQDVEAVRRRISDGAHGRHPRASARQRPHRRVARPQHLDRGRHHAAPAVHAGGRRVGCRAVRRAPGGPVAQRSHGRPAHRRPEGVHRRERAARHGDQLLPEERRDRRRQDLDQRRIGPDAVRGRGAEERRHQSHALGAERAAARPGARRRRRLRRRRRRARAASAESQLRGAGREAVAAAVAGGRGGAGGIDAGDLHGEAVGRREGLHEDRARCSRIGGSTRNSDQPGRA